MINDWLLKNVIHCLLIVLISFRTVIKYKAFVSKYECNKNEIRYIVIKIITYLNQI